MIADKFVCHFVEVCSRNTWSDDLGHFSQGPSEQVITAAQELDLFFSLEVDHFVLICHCA